MVQTKFIEGAQAAFLGFVESLPQEADIACVCHNDVDGMAAAVLLAHALQPRFRFRIVATRKAETAWSERVQRELQYRKPVALIACDLSPRSTPVLDRIPELVLDHHSVEGVAPGTVLITGYGQQPVPTSGLLAFWCGSALAELSRWNWIAGMSVLADMGDLEACPDARDWLAAHPSVAIRESISLLNSPRRVADGDPSAAVRVLLKADSPADIMDRDNPDVQALFSARTEFQQALAQAKRTAPRFSGRAAMIMVNSSCQVHPVIAQLWRSRLPKYVVIAVNVGYRHGYVHFSVRSATGVNLIHFLKQHAPREAGDNFARGHDQATGGSVTVTAWNEFAERLGFGPEMEVHEAA